MSFGANPFLQGEEALLCSEQSPNGPARQATSRAASSPSFSTDYQTAQFASNPFPRSHSQPDEGPWIDYHPHIIQTHSSEQYIHQSGLVIPIARTKPVARASASSISSFNPRRQSPNIKMPPKKAVVFVRLSIDTKQEDPQDRAHEPSRVLRVGQEEAADLIEDWPSVRSLQGS